MPTQNTSSMWMGPEEREEGGEGEREGERKGGREGKKEGKEGGREGGRGDEKTGRQHHEVGQK